MDQLTASINIRRVSEEAFEMTPAPATVPDYRHPAWGLSTWAGKPQPVRDGQPHHHLIMIIIVNDDCCWCFMPLMGDLLCSSTWPEYSLLKGLVLLHKSLQMLYFKYWKELYVHGWSYTFSHIRHSFKSIIMTFPEWLKHIDCPIKHNFYSEADYSHRILHTDTDAHVGDVHFSQGPLNMGTWLLEATNIMSKSSDWAPSRREHIKLRFQEHERLPEPQPWESSTRVQGSYLGLPRDQWGWTLYRTQYLFLVTKSSLCGFGTHSAVCFCYLLIH